MRIDLNKIHIHLEKVPIVSNFKNLIDIFIAKLSSKPTTTPDKPSAFHVWKVYAHSKSKTKLAVMTLVPIFSNLAYGIIEGKKKPEIASKPIHNPTPTPRNKHQQEQIDYINTFFKPLEGRSENSIISTPVITPADSSNLSKAIRPKQGLAIPQNWQEVINTLKAAQNQFYQALLKQPDDKTFNALNNKFLLIEIVIEKITEYANQFPDLPKIEVFELSDPKRFQYDSMQWKKEVFSKDRPIGLELSSELLAYPHHDNSPDAYTQNAANRALGGGWDGKNFVLEECMVAEEAQFMALLMMNIKTSLKTREPPSVPTESGNSGVGGNPTPLLLTGLQRFINAGALYGNKIQNKAYKLEELRKIVELDEVQPVSLVCLAAPRINAEDNKCSKELVEDLFNTFLANFELVKEHGSAHGKNEIRVDAVKVGTGVFHNDPVVVCCLQILAARHAGIDHLKLHQVDENVKNTSLKITQDLLKDFPESGTVEDLLNKFIEKFPS